MRTDRVLVRRLSVSIAVLIVLLVTTLALQLPAQARPAGASRVWAELGIEANVQTQNCGSCVRHGNSAGPAFSWAVGSTLPSGFGIAIAGRNFQEFSFEHAQHSRFVLLLGQYAPSAFRNLTVNVGAGQAKHDSDPGDTYRNYFNGAVVSGGVALRMPARSRPAFTVNANILKRVGGATDFRPTTFSFGIGFNLSTRCRNHDC